MPETVIATLAPTNTGKTHRAIERMLDFPTGMMGLPLRLLAREVYDRVAAKVGLDRVALITGEEKRVGRETAYWICTAEAMPVSRQVDFLAIDEIQLAAHEQRGHVFTDRLLHARGRSETWLMGSDTMRTLVSQLISHVEVRSHPRLSTLTHTGAAPLSRLPPRSAVVAFSMVEVYAIAERLRTGKGGAAVVLGALSPRTRNAQVAMFQAGEVDYLVATDAIGMGLNLDVQHVAFAALEKFDGRRVRHLEPSELGQIAGRAGRFLQNGTFGTVAPLALPAWAAREVQTQRFTSVERVRWRRHELDFSSLASLRASLREGPRSALLLPMNDAEDLAALEALAGRIACASEAEVRLLWEVCGIPDFKKLLFEAHLDDLQAVYAALREGLISDAWMEARVRRLENTSGDVDDLTARIAALRTWAYVSNRAEWMENALRWQERTRAAEDALSDALHEALVARFVQRKKKRAVATSFGALETWAQTPSAPSVSEDAWQELVDAEHERFFLDGDGVISAKVLQAPLPLADLSPGRVLTQPSVRMRELPVRPGLKQQLERRVVAFVRDTVSRFMAPVHALARTDSPSVRALGFALEQGLGTTHTLPRLTERDRDILRRHGVRLTAKGATLALDRTVRHALLGNKR